MAVQAGMVTETYPLVPPFSYAKIETLSSGQLQYSIVETPLNNNENRVLKMISDVITETLEFDFSKIQNRNAATDYLRGKVLDIVQNYNVPLDENSFEKVFYNINKEFLGFGIIDPLLYDPNIEDISCDGTGIPVFVWHRKYESIPTNIQFNTDDDLNSLIIKVAQRAGRHISVAEPLLDSALPDGSRINCTYGREITMRGPTFTIRKFPTDPLTIIDLIAFNTLDDKMAAFFWFILEYGKSILIAGGTATGKTTLLNGIAMFIRPGSKIVSIEDTPELNIPHENWIQSVSRSGFGGIATKTGHRRGEITMYDLLRAAVRQRPDFLFVGEVRGAEAYTLFQAIATGHAGMATIHGDSSQGIIRRLESEPMNTPRAMIQALSMVAVQRKVRLGTKQVRRTVEVVEIVGLDPSTNDLVTNRKFSWDPRDDVFIDYGRSYVLEQIMNLHGFTESYVKDELEKRALIMRALVRTKKRSFNDVAEAVLSYYSNSDAAYDKYNKILKGLGA